jgi:hypothetical protein
MTTKDSSCSAGTGPAGETGGPGPARFSGRQLRELRELIVDDAWLDELIDRAEEGGVSLAGLGGFLSEMITVLERVWRPS